MTTISDQINYTEKFLPAIIVQLVKELKDVSSAKVQERFFTCLDRFGDLSRAARGKEVLDEVIEDLKQMELGIDFSKVTTPGSLKEALDELIKKGETELCSRLRGYRDELVEIESFGKLREEGGIPLYVFNDLSRLDAQLKSKNIIHVNKKEQLLAMDSVSDFFASSGLFSDLEKVECHGLYALSRQYNVVVFAPAYKVELKILRQIFAKIINGKKGRATELRENIAKFRFHFIRTSPLMRKNRDVADFFERLFYQYHELGSPKYESGIDPNNEVILTLDQKVFEKSYFTSCFQEEDSLKSLQDVRPRSASKSFFRRISSRKLPKFK